MSSSPRREFVVNPSTSRLILKDGARHRQWRRAHPNAEELPVVHRSQPQRQQLHARESRVSSGGDAGGTNAADRSLSPPPLRRAGALGEEGMRALLNDVEEPTLEDDPDALADEILARHGPALLEAYRNSSVDFLQAAASLLGIVSENK